MLIAFVHGWSVTNTETYGGLPEALVLNADPKLDLQIAHIYLGKYVSFADEVVLDDIARGMQAAVIDQIKPRLENGERFAAITHSTGGPVVRKWIDLYYRDKLEQCPVSHLVMLAPANHGSALAQLGKSRLSRLKFAMQERKEGAPPLEPGTGVLDWLELGSDEGWELNRQWLEYDCVSAGLYPFVLTGQTIDRKLYDNLNSYTGEPGSDGVVRVAAASMNYGLIRIVQHKKGVKLHKDSRSALTAMGVLPGCSHSGQDIGIIRSVNADQDAADHPTIEWVLGCLSVGSKSAYHKLRRDLDQLTETTQENERRRRAPSFLVFKRTFVTNRYCMLVIRIIDDRGRALHDYDVLFTAGPDYDENHLPAGFFVDRQRNQHNPGKLTYFIDYDVMKDGFATKALDDCFGFRIVARPEQGGFAYYTKAEYRGRFSQLRRYLAPNQTLMIEVELQRHVDAGVFSFTRRDEIATGEEDADVTRVPFGEDIA